MSVERAYSNRDYYAVLGVDRYASDHDIKAAFRHQALLYHPDVNPGDDAARRFQDIKEAYEMLGNPARRRRYDEECAEFAHSRARAYAPARRSRQRASAVAASGEETLAQTWRDFWRDERRVLAFAGRGVWRVLRRAIIVVAVVIAALLIGATASQMLNRAAAPSGSPRATPGPVPLHARSGGEDTPRYLYGVCVSHCPTARATLAAPAQTHQASEKPLYLYGVCVRHCARSSRKE